MRTPKKCNQSCFHSQTGIVHRQKAIYAPSGLVIVLWITKEQIKAVGRIVSLIKSQLSKPVVQIKEIIIKMNANGLPMAVPIPPPATAPMAAATSSFPSYRKTAQVELTQNQKDQLKAQGYTDGLIDIITKSVSYFPHRVWVVDNSGSKCK